MERTASRRELIIGAVGATAAASVAALSAPADAVAATGSEGKALTNALEIERLAVIAYRQALARNVLSAGAAAQGRLLLAQELQHVAKLESALGQIGVAVPSGPAGVAAAQAVLAQHQVFGNLTDLPTQHEALRLLIDIESLAEGAYFSAIPQLEHPTLVQICLEMMGSDAQHWTVLSGIQHNGDVVLSVPYPFVQGSP